jgi:hypothetical protein
MRQVRTFRRWAVFTVLGAVATAGCFFEEDPQGDDDDDDETGGSSPWSGKKGGSGGGPAGGASSGGTIARGGTSTGGGFQTGGSDAGGTSAGGAAATGGGLPTGGTNPAGGAFPTGGTGPIPTGGTTTGGSSAGGSLPTGGATTGGTSSGGSTPTGGTGGTGSGAVMKFCNDLVLDGADIALTVVFSGVRATAVSGTCTPVVPNACIPIPTGTNPTVALLDGTEEILSGSFPTLTVLSGDEIFVLATIDELGYPGLYADTFELLFGTSCASTDPFLLTSPSETRESSFSGIQPRSATPSRSRSAAYSSLTEYVKRSAL